MYHGQTSTINKSKEIKPEKGFLRKRYFSLSKTLMLVLRILLILRAYVRAELGVLRQFENAYCEPSIIERH